MEKICNVKHGSTIRFELDGKWLKGCNRYEDGKYKIYIYEPSSKKTVEIDDPNTLVEVIQPGGFQLEVTEVRVS